MKKKIYITAQKMIPQHLFSRFMGRIADSTNPIIKNFFIKQFVQHFHVDLHEAEIENATAYSSFNQFFIRKLKPQCRPIVEGDDTIASPVDGTIADIGEIRSNVMLQAKHFDFDLENLLGDHHLAKDFYHGLYATLYLAPHNYHRVHMPLDGKLIKTIFIPGKLFSVNRLTTEYVPQLFSRNERLVAIFETAAGRMALIMVGAMIVGSIQMAWMEHPVFSQTIRIQTFSEGQVFKKGSDIGHFKMGSTVILLFQPKQVYLNSDLIVGGSVKFGQLFGKILP